MIRCIFLVWLVFGVIASAVHPASVAAAGFGDKSKQLPASAADIRKATEKAETAHDIQRDFPGATAAERAIIRAAPLRQEKEIKAEESKPSWWQRMLASGLLRLLQFAGWGLLTLLALGLIYVAATSSGVWERRRREKGLEVASA